MKHTPTRTTKRAAGEPIPERFDDYEVHGVKQYRERHGSWCEQVPDDEADFWSLFGHIPGGGLDCIGDFATRSHAEEIFARITGTLYQVRRPV